MPMREPWLPREAIPSRSRIGEALTMKQRAIEQWENEGGMIPNGQRTSIRERSFHKSTRVRAELSDISVPSGFHSVLSPAQVSGKKQN